MELYLKRYFWILPLVVVIVCAVLAAMAANHFIEGKYLLGEESAKKPAKAKTRKTEPKVVSKEGAPVVARNMFCSTCEPPQPVAATNTAPAVVDSNAPPPTTLPLALLATFVARDEVFSSATIANTQSQKSGGYWLGEDIPDAGKIMRITSRFVDFHNRTANRLERIDIMGVPPPAPVTPTVAPADDKPAKPGQDPDFLAMLDKGIKKVDDTHYEIDRGLVDKVLGDPNLVSRSARIVPSIKDGKANGFKVYAIRPNSAFAKIGLQNGDTLHSVNGYEMSSPDKALEVYTKVKSANNLSISITRRGQPVTMEYTIK